MASKFAITAQINLQTNNLNQVVGNLKNSLNDISIKVNVKDLNAASNNIRSIAKESKNASAAAHSLGSDIAAAAKRFSAVTLATGTLIGLTRAIKNSAVEAIEFEREIVKISQASGKTVEQLRGLERQVTNISTSFGVSSKELLLAARTLTQAGFAADKASGALKVLAQTELAATFDSIQDTTEGAIALLNQFGKEAQKTGSEIDFLERSLSAINKVSKEFAVESSDLITAVRTTGSAFETAGGSLNELIALFTSVRATTRESAESIATGFRTIFTRTQRLDTINNLRQLGIELQDAEGKFVGPMEAVKRLSAALSTLDPKDFRFNLVVEELGGFRQVSKVIPLIQQLSVAQKALNVAQGASGDLAKDAQVAQQSLAIQISKTREKFSAFIRDLTQGDTFQNTAKAILSIADAFLRVANVIKPIIPLIAGFAAFKIGSSITESFLNFSDVSKQKRNAGGRIYKFATGGMVPGHGNGDTVPAMLTPGEFVIKKSSVKKLGASKLASINKYAGGGIVDEPSVGAAILEPGVDIRTTYKFPDEMIKDVDTDSKTKKKLAGKSWNIIKEGLSPDTFEIFRDAIESGLSSGLETAIANSGKFTGIKPIKLTDSNKKSFLNTINDGSYANMFEQILTYVSNNGEFDNNSDPRKPFDFTNGLPSSLEKDYQNLRGVKYIDAKVSTAAASDLTEKIIRQIEYKNTFKGRDKRYQQEELEAARTKPSKEEKRIVLENRTTATKEEADKLSVMDRVFTAFSKDNNVKEMRPKGFTANFSLLSKKGGPSAEFTRLFGLAYKENPSEKTILKYLSDNTEPFKYATGGFVDKFAAGGFASGTDTVPAMLTPGEFVVNKKSAQAIGYSKLHRMNKVGKYARGGVVADGEGNTPYTSEDIGQLQDWGYYVNDKSVKPYFSKEINTIFSSLTNSKKIKNLIDEGKIDFTSLYKELSVFTDLIESHSAATPGKLYSGISGIRFGDIISQLFDKNELAQVGWNGYGFKGASEQLLSLYIKTIANNKKFDLFGAPLMATDNLENAKQYAKNTSSDFIDSSLLKLNIDDIMTTGIGYADENKNKNLLLPASSYRINDASNIGSNVLIDVAKIGKSKNPVDKFSTNISKIKTEAKDTKELALKLSQYYEKQLPLGLSLDNSDDVKTVSGTAKKIKAKPGGGGYRKHLKDELKNVPREDILSTIDEFYQDNIDNLSSLGGLPVSLNTNVKYKKNKLFTEYTKKQIEALAAYVSGPAAEVDYEDVGAPTGSGGINGLIDHLDKGLRPDFINDKDQKELHKYIKSLDAAVNKKAYIPPTVYSGIHGGRLKDVLHQLFTKDQLDAASWSDKDLSFKSSDGRYTWRDGFSELDKNAPDGETFRIPSFMSTSRSKRIAKRFASNPYASTLLNIKTKRSKLGRAKTAFLDSIEEENILPRDSSFKINKFFNDGDGMNFNVQQLRDGGEPEKIKSSIKQVARSQAKLADSYVENSDRPHINLLRKSVLLDEQDKDKLSNAYGIPKKYKIGKDNKKYGVYRRQTKSSGQDIYRIFENIVVEKNKEWELNNAKDAADEIDIVNKTMDSIGDIKFTSKAVSSKSLLGKATKWMIKQDKATAVNANSSFGRRFFKENVLDKNDTPGIDFTVFEPPFAKSISSPSDIFTKDSILDAMGLPRDTIASKYDKIAGKEIARLANGGFASGTDTVPAMLTPGEFVINKKSAQAIGYSSLNRMNKVGKYAQGGIVQHFANGDKVDDFNPLGNTYSSKNRFAKIAVSEIDTKVAEANERRVQAVKTGDVKLEKEMQDLLKQLIIAKKGIQSLDFTKIPAKEIEKASRHILKSMHDAGDQFEFTKDSVKELNAIMKIAAKKFKKIEGNIKNLSKELKDQKDSASVSKDFFKGLGHSEKDIKSMSKTDPSKIKFSEKDIDSVASGYASALNDAADKTQMLSRRFVALSGMVTSIAVQFSDLEQPTKDAISAFTATFTAVHAVGSGFLDVVQGIAAEKKSRQLAQTSLKLHASALASYTRNIQSLSAAIKIEKAKLKSDNAVNFGGGGGGRGMGRGMARGMGKGGSGKGKALSNAGAATGDPRLMAAGAVAEIPTKAFEYAMGVANNALLGFSAFVSAASAAVAYYQSVSEKYARQLEKSVESLKSVDTQNLVSKESLSTQAENAFSNATRSSLMSQSLSSPEKMIDEVAIIGSVAAIGTAIHPVVGALGSLAAGLYLSYKFLKEQDEEYKKVEGSIKEISKTFASVSIDTAKTLKEYNNFIKNIDNKKIPEIGDQLGIVASEFLIQTMKIVEAERLAAQAFNGLNKVPELIKNNLEHLKTIIGDLNKAFEALVSNIIQKSARDLQNAADIGGDRRTVIKSALAEFKKGNEQRIKAQTALEFNPRIEQAVQNQIATEELVKGRSLTDDEKKGVSKRIRGQAEQQMGEINKTRTIISEMEFEKQLKELELQALKNAKAAIQERISREKIIGTLRTQLATKIVIENLNHTLENLNKKVGELDSAFSGTVTGLKSSMPNIKVLDLFKPTGKNLEEFNKALDVIRGSGPFDDTRGELANNIGTAKTAQQNLELALSNTGNISGAEDVDKIIRDIFGGQKGSGGAVEDALREMFNRMVKPEEGEVNAGRGINSEQGRQRLLQEFNDWVKNLTERGKQIIQTLSEYEQQQRELYQKINESRERQLQLQLDDVDSYDRYISAVARARGREVGLAEKNALRFEKQKRSVGGLAGNIDAIGATLLDARNRLQNNTDPAQQRGLAETANRTERALKELANQSERTADTLQEIDKIKAQREGVRDVAKEFAIGGTEQRQELQKNIANALSVAQTGTFESLQGEDRSGASAILERFKDLPIFNGSTGRQVENKAIANSVRAAGGNEEIAQMIEQDTSTPEEQLIQELRSIYEEESRAREYLYAQENSYQQVLIGMLADNAQATRDLTQQLQNEKQALGGGKDVDLKERDKQLDISISNVIDDIDFLGDAIWVFEQSLTEALKRLNNLLDIPPLSPFQEMVRIFKKAVNQMVDSMLAAMNKILTFLQNNPLAILDIFGGFGGLLSGGAGHAGAGIAAGAAAGAAAGKSSGGLIYRQNGGLSFNPDSSIFKPKGTDTVPAMLSAGEYVIKRSSVDKIGVDTLDAINKGQYAANGGVIYRAIGGIGASAPGGSGYFNIKDKDIIGFGGRNKFDQNLAFNQTDMARMGGGLYQMAPLFNTSGLDNPFDIYNNVFGKKYEYMKQRSSYSSNRIHQNMFKGLQYGRDLISSGKWNGIGGGFDRKTGMQGFSPFNPWGFAVGGSVGGLDEVRSNIKNTINPDTNFSSFLGNRMNNGTMLRPLFGFDSNYVDPMSYIGNYYENTRNKLANTAQNRSNRVHNNFFKQMSYGRNLINSGQWNGIGGGFDRETGMQGFSPFNPWGLSSGGPIYRMFGGNAQSMLNPFAAAAFNQSMGFAKNAYENNFAHTRENLASKSNAASQGIYSNFYNNLNNGSILKLFKNGAAMDKNRRTRISNKKIARNARKTEELEELHRQRRREFDDDNMSEMNRYMNRSNRPNFMTDRDNTPEARKWTRDLMYVMNFSEAGGDGYGFREMMWEDSGGKGYGSDNSVFNPDSPYYMDKNPFIMNHHGYMRNNKKVHINTGYWRATGGFVGSKAFQSGGSTGGDSVPAMLTPGEFVMNRETVQNYGPGFMSQLNGGNVPKFATGGYVGGPVYKAAGGGIGGSMGNVDFSMIGNMIGSSIQNSLSGIGKIVNFEALNNLASAFSSLVNRLGSVASSLGGMNMTHTVRIDGQVNVGGINTKYIAESIKQEVAGMIYSEVKRLFDQQLNMARNINPMG